MINKRYLENVEDVSKAFYSNKELPHVVLFDFFDEKFLQELKSKVNEFKRDRDVLSHSFAKGSVDINFDELVSFVEEVIKKKISA